MKARKFFLGLTLACVPSVALVAQTGVASGTSYGHGEDSVRCLDNISLFVTDVKGGDFASAIAPWEAAYKECPASTKNIYIYGVKIIKWQYENEKDSAKKKALIDELMALYDSRMKYFGDEPGYGPDWIVTSRITDYINMVGPDNVNYDQVYGWTKPVVEQMKEKANPQTLYYFVNASLNKAAKDTKFKEQYINDYMFASEALEKQLQATADTAQQQIIIAIKNPMDDYFARSGLADCQTLVKLYTPKFEAHAKDVDFLTSMLTMFRMASCDNSPLYLKASRSLFDVKPTAEAAMGLANESIEAKKNAEAIGYLQQAISLTNNADRRATCNYTIGVVYMNQHNYSEARAYFNRALAEKPSYGEAMINIAQMYANTVSSLFPDDKTKQRCVYYLVIDKLERARQIDPRVAGKAASLIATYRKYLPSAADIFMHPDLEKGKSFQVGAWIGESVVIR